MAKSIYIKENTLVQKILEPYEKMYPYMKFLYKSEIPGITPASIAVKCGDYGAYTYLNGDLLGSEVEMILESITRSIVKDYAEEHSEKTYS